MRVLVTGPPGAGVRSLIAVLRTELPQIVFTDAPAHHDAPDPPAVVLFVVSAAAPMTASDIAILDRVAARTDAVIAVLSKVDRCRWWHQVLTDNRALVAECGQRYRQMVWTTAAVAPDIGPPAVADVVSALAAALADDDVARRNSLRARADELHRELTDFDRMVDADVLSVLRARRTDAVERSLARRRNEMADVRAGYQQVRLRLNNEITAGCVRLRAELQERAGAVTRRTVKPFTDTATERIGVFTAEVGETAMSEINCVAASLGLPTPQVPALEPPAAGSAPVRSAGLENRLSALLAAGFGLGVAVAVGRVFAGIAPDLIVGLPVVSALTGFAVMMWVVRTRGLLRDRAVLDRWVGELIATVRPTLQGAVTAQLLAAESAGAAAVAERARVADAQLCRQLSRLDEQVRRAEREAARAAAERDRRAPQLRRSLADIEDRLRRTMLE